MENYCRNCGNEDLKFVKYIIANGRVQIRQQCFECGILYNENFKFSLFGDIDLLPIFSKELRETYKISRILKSANKHNLGRKKYYNDVYLKSDEWKTKRKHILLRDNNKCVCCQDDATQVHHISYNNVFSEHSYDLISVCNDCHNKIHFDGVIYFKGLKANYNVLQNCNSCKEYHNDQSGNLCNQCKLKFKYDTA